MAGRLQPWGQPDTAAKRAAEGRLFGLAADEGTTASQVRLRLDWRGGTAGRGEWGKFQFAELVHQEVKQKPGVALYLGYGPVDVGNKLKRSAFLPPGLPRKLAVGVPDAEADRFRQTLRLIHVLGALGSRSRNGWGSIQFDQGALLAEEVSQLLDPAARAGRDWLRPFASDWEQALASDWCHVVGSDAKGLLLWRTKPCARWEQALKLLAEVKIAFRTQFHFKGRGPHAALCDRQVLAYPITNHGLSAKGWDRSANQVVFKVLAVREDYIGVAAHLPHGLPEPLATALQPSDQKGLRRREWEVWSKVHRVLDTHLTRLP